MVETIIKQLGNITKIITWLNLKRVMLLTVAALVGLTLLTMYEQRDKITDAVETRDVEINGRPVKTNVIVVSPEMQTKIKKLVDDSPLITAISVLNTDLRLNQRTVIYQYADTPVISEAWERFYREHGYIQQIFTTSDKNNTQMVSVINGEFSCVKYEDTLNAALLPENKIAEPVICRISLPPYYGEFSGYLVIALAKVPTPIEQNEVMIQAKSLSNEIFLKNVVKR